MTSIPSGGGFSSALQYSSFVPDPQTQVSAPADSTAAPPPPPPPADTSDSGSNPFSPGGQTSAQSPALTSFISSILSQPPQTTGSSDSSSGSGSSEYADALSALQSTLQSQSANSLPTSYGSDGSGIQDSGGSALLLNTLA